MGTKPENNPPDDDTGGGAGAVDTDKLAKLIEDGIGAAFQRALAERDDKSGGQGGADKGGQPAAGDGGSTGGGGAGAGGVGSIGDAISAAVNKALAERDREDALAVLADEVRQLKDRVAREPAERQRGWGSYIVGTGLLRR